MTSFFGEDGEILDQAWQLINEHGDDITSWPMYAENDATEKRLWSPNGDLIECWTRATTRDEWERDQ